MVESTDTRRLHPKHGPHRPHTGTPARRPGSLRRTTTHTSLRPDGLLGDVQLSARGRDLWTAPDGSSHTLAASTLDARVSYVPDRSLSALSVDPPLGPAGEQLVGLRVSSGFRKALDQALPDTGEEGGREGSLRYQLLDELPTAVLVSGFAIAAGGVHPPRGTFDLSRNADICAGWATGATILVEADELGHVPAVTGPVAPALEAVGDPEGWHRPGRMGPHAMRRWRRLDIWTAGDGAPVEVEAFFRDSHVDDAGLETVVHEYLVVAELDPVTHVFLSIEARLGVLPWVECPGALASAGRLAGAWPGDLRQRVRDTFVGTSTCTHLNDTLRSLAALPHLAAIVTGGGRTG